MRFLSGSCWSAAGLRTSGPSRKVSGESPSRDAVAQMQCSCQILKPCRSHSLGWPGKRRGLLAVPQSLNGGVRLAAHRAVLHQGGVQELHRGWRTDDPLAVRRQALTAKMQACVQRIRVQQSESAAPWRVVPRSPRHLRSWRSMSAKKEASTSGAGTCGGRSVGALQPCQYLKYRRPNGKSKGADREF